MTGLKHFAVTAWQLIAQLKPKEHPVTDSPNPVCPACGDPYIGGPGCYENQCAATCGDPDHKPGDCTERCYNPHLYGDESA